MFAIETQQLTKIFDRVAVLRGLDLQVPTGQIYGLLGPNGTGKTTLLHLLLGFLRPTRGRVRVLGLANTERARARVGYLPERQRYHLRFTAREYLRYLGAFSDLPAAKLRARIDEGLRTVGLQDAANRQLATYSRGMLQRLGVAQALLGEPELLLIDEPTAGLEPAGQQELLDVLDTLRSRRQTIFMTTHHFSEAEQVCDRVGVLFGGKLAAEADVAALRTPGRNVVVKVAELPAELAARLERLAPAVRCRTNQITLQPNTPFLQAQVLRILLDAPVAILSLEPQSRPLEDLYLQIVRGEAPEIPPDDEPLPTEAVGTTPPNGLFAPPGHPDALTAPAPPAEATPAPAEPAAPRRVGDTLLRELLRRDDTDRDESGGKP